MNSNSVRVSAATSRRAARRTGWRRWRRTWTAWPPRTSTGCLTPPWPSRRSSCGSRWTAWRANGCSASPPSTPAGPPGPSTAPRPPPPPAGCQVGSTWAPAPPPAPCGPPEPCSPAPSPQRPRPYAPASSRPPTPPCWPTAPTTSPTTPRPRPSRCWWPRPTGTTHPGCDGSSATGTWWPTQTALPARPSGAMGDGACGWPPPGRAWSPSTACWSQRPARSCWPPWRPGPPPQRQRPPQQRPAPRRRLTELARRPLEGGQLPQTGGVRPQLTVVVDLDSLLGRQEAIGGEAGWAGPLAPEACRRLACDGALTRVLVTRQPTGHPGGHHDPHGDPDHHPGSQDGLADRLQAAMALLPPVLSGAASQPLEVGRASRVITPAQHSALAVRDGGCVFPDCDRPLAWCEAHHLVFWLDGGPTDLANLALLCRAHHQHVHEGGWQLIRGPDGRFTATPPHRRPRTAA